MLRDKLKTTEQNVNIFILGVFFNVKNTQNGQSLNVCLLNLTVQ